MKKSPIVRNTAAKDRHVLEHTTHTTHNPQQKKATKLVSAMGKLDAVRQSPASIMQNCKKARRAYDRAWSSAARAPMFCKIVKKTTSDGKVCRYTHPQAPCNSPTLTICFCCLPLISEQEILPYGAPHRLSRLHDRCLRRRRKRLDGGGGGV